MFKLISRYLFLPIYYISRRINRIFKKNEQLKICNKNGFTLIELLIVTIIVGILAAISLPNFLSQVGKARETEAKNSLSALARFQQAYHFEKKSFADDFDKLSLNVSVNSEYYSFPPPNLPNVNLVKHQAIATDPLTDRVRNYAIGVYFSAGNFDIFFCESRDIDELINVPDNPSGNCTNGGKKIR
ncbi:MAG: type IV pilin protein [Cyanophyceae cyanobacterium]